MPTGLLLLAALLAASAAGAAPAARGTLRVALWAEPDVLNPVLSTTLAEQDVNFCLFRYLFKYDENDQLVADLCAEVPTVDNLSLSSDGRTYLLKLRPDVRWHDGPPFTSEDVKFTIEAIRNPKSQSQHASLLKHIEKIETPDAQTVVIRLSRAYLPFLDALTAFAPIPAHVFRPGEAVAKHAFGRKPIGTGAFELAEWVSGSHLTVVRRRDARPGGPPGLDRIVFQFVPAQNTRLVMAKSGEVDVLEINFPDHADEAKKIAHLSNLEVPTMSWVYLGLNHKRPVFRDRRVRLAMHHAVPKDEIVRQIYRGLGESAWSAFHPRCWAYTADVLKPAHDPERAKALLEEAGWRVGPDRIRMKDGQKFSFSISGVAQQQLTERAQTVLQASFRDIGLECRIQNYPGTHLYAPASSGGIVRTGKYDALYAGFVFSAEPLETMWLSYDTPPTGENRFWYWNPTVDRHLEEAISTVDRERRKSLYHAAQKALAEDVAVIPIATRRNLWVFPPKLKGLSPAPAGGGFWNVETWRME